MSKSQMSAIDKLLSRTHLVLFVVKIKRLSLFASIASFHI